MESGRLISWLIVLSGMSVICACGNVTGNSDSSNATGWDENFKMSRAEDQHLSGEQRTAYTQDAEKLAVRYINEEDSTQTDIPQELIGVLYNGLIHIVNTDHPKAREATHEYYVHARTPANPREILVYADTTVSWIDSWRNGHTETGNEELDGLIEQFDFTLVEYSELANVLPGAMATLRSNRAINVYAVGRLFEKLNHIESAGPDGITDGSDIEVLFFDNYLRFTFELGFGDCPSGCINRHLWHFKVNRDGSVEYESEKGPLPDDN